MLYFAYGSNLHQKQMKRRCKNSKYIGCYTLKNFKLLYVGRIRVEKGIFSLASLIKNKRDISLTIVGAEKNTSYKINQSNINIQLTQSNKVRLIKYYDDQSDEFLT